MTKSLHVAVCGATGAVGREMLKTFAERNYILLRNGRTDDFA